MNDDPLLRALAEHDGAPLDARTAARVLAVARVELAPRDSPPRRAPFELPRPLVPALLAAAALVSTLDTVVKAARAFL